MQAILQGKKRVLLTMATGTGKTDRRVSNLLEALVAMWNDKGDPTRKPRSSTSPTATSWWTIPKDKTFSPFGDARHKIEGGKVEQRPGTLFRHLSIHRQGRTRPGLYKEFPPDFFDLIIVDECHRGSAKDESNWREILEYFAPAYPARHDRHAHARRQSRHLPLFWQSRSTPTA